MPNVIFQLSKHLLNKSNRNFPDASNNKEFLDIFFKDLKRREKAHSLFDRTYIMFY